MLPRFRPHVSFSDLYCLLDGRVGNPEEIDTEFARALGYPHAVWFPYGRVAVRAYLESLQERSPHPQVVVSPFNCVALGNGIVSANWRPTYVDTAVDSFNQDEKQFLEALHRPEVRAGIVVSLWGIAPSSEFIRQLPNRPILHDYALRALDPNPAPLRESADSQDGAIYSLAWGKPLGSLGGALLCGFNPDLAKKWREWRQKNLIRGPSMSSIWDAIFLKIAFNPMIFGVGASLRKHFPVGRRLSGQESQRGAVLPKNWNKMASSGYFNLALKRLMQRNQLAEERANQVAFYLDHLSLSADKLKITLPPATPWLSHFAIQSQDRDQLRDRFKKAGIFISTELYDRLLCDYQWLKFESQSHFPHARTLVAKSFHLPLFHGLGQKDQLRVIQVFQA